MAENKKCTWNPAEHKGESCPHHEGGGADDFDNDFEEEFKEGLSDKEAEMRLAEEDDAKSAFEEVNDFDEEFNESSYKDEKQYVDKIMTDIADASNKKSFESISDYIDKLTEDGLISEETSDRLYNALDKKIDENVEEFEEVSDVDLEPAKNEKYSFQTSKPILESDGHHGEYEIGAEKSQETIKATSLEDALKQLAQKFKKGISVSVITLPDGKKIDLREYDSDSYTPEEAINKANLKHYK